MKGLTWKQREERAARELASTQRTVTRCLHCQWSFKGLLRDGRKAFLAHRELRHGDAK